MFKSFSFKLNKKELNLFILCCIIVTTILAYVVVIEPCLKGYESIKKAIGQRQVKLLKLQKALLLREPIELFYLEILPRLSQIGSDEERFALFLKEAESSSRRSNIYITSLKPMGIIDKGNYKEYLIRMEAEGKLCSLSRFLYNLPNSGQLISLKELQISYLSQEENLLRFQMNLGRMVVDIKDEK